MPPNQQPKAEAASGAQAPQAAAPAIEQVHSDANLRLFVDQAPAAIAMFDGAMRYLAASRRWIEVYGLSGRDLIGRSHYEIFPEIPERWREFHRRGLAGERLDAQEDRFERQDGSVQWLHWEIQPWYAQGAVGGIFIFVEDITERKRAEELDRERLERAVAERTRELDEQRAHLQALLELREGMLQSSSTGIAVYRHDGNCVLANAALAHIIGVDQAYVLERNFRGLKSWKDCGLLDCALRVLATGQRESVDVDLLTPQGRDLRLSCSLSRFGSDHDAQLLLIAVDRTLERDTRALLARSEAGLRATLDNLPFPTWLKDVEGRYVHVNKACANQLQLRDASAAIGRTDDALQPPEVAHRNRADEQQVLRTRREMHVEERVSDGRRLRWLETFHAPVVDADSRLLGTAGFSRDVTRQHEGEEALRRLNRALRLVGDFNELLERARDEQALLDGVCMETVHTGGYLLAWIGYREDDEDKSLRVVARAGRDEGYVDALRVTWADTDRGRGPSGTAVRTGVTQVNQDWEVNPMVGPWRTAALARGFRSSISIPLSINERVIGALTLYAGETFAFAAEEATLLEELAAKLSFGIKSLRTASARRAAEASLGESEARYRFMLENAADGVLITDPQGNCIYANRRACAILGYTRRELLELSIDDLAPEGPVERELADPGQAAAEQAIKDGGLRAEVWQRRRDGSLVPVEINAVELPDGNVYRSLRDISERLQYQDRLQHQATHDALTNLPNRSLFRDRLEQEIRKANRTSALVALLFIDLDGFKEVNDTLGHAAGDALLKEVAERLLRCVRGTDTVARVGGDEFLVILPEIPDLERVRLLADAVVETVGEPYLHEDERAYVTASVGVSVYPSDTADPTMLLVDAERAMHQAKAEGKNRITFFTPELQRKAQEGFQILRDLHEALPQRQLVLHFQPIVDLASGELRKVEALVRWLHPERGLVGPAAFIPLLERSALMSDVGDWIFQEAAAHAQRWTQLLGRPLKVGVNVSAAQFRDRSLLRKWVRHLAQIGVPCSSLFLELTEGVLIQDDPDVMQTLLGFREAGMEVAIDDFGTGYSSLSYLSRFEIDYLKIDRSFTRNVTALANDYVVTKAIIAMGHELGVKVIAEGIETPSQRTLLLEAGCDLGQGYHFSQPLPADELEKRLLAQAIPAFGAP